MQVARTTGPHVLSAQLVQYSYKTGFHIQANTYNASNAHPRSAPCVLERTQVTRVCVPSECGAEREGSYRR